MKYEHPTLGPGWNGAHRSLISSRRAIVRNVEDLDESIANLQKSLDGARDLRVANVRELEDVDTAIANSAYEPPQGFDKWGESA